MKVLIRADASVHMGTGHVMRCLALAKALSDVAEVHFACRNEPGNLSELIQSSGFTVFRLPADLALDEEDDAQACQQLAAPHYELLIVDHYQLTARFSTAMRQSCNTVMVIDDLADRAQDCDLLLDQNLLPNAELRYRSLVPEHCIMLLGPQYALLRDEFFQPPAPRQNHRILVGFGGSDEKNLTALAIRAIRTLKVSGLTADIVVGASNPWQQELRALLASESAMNLHVQCNYMARLMQQATLMLGSGGTSHWERGRCRLPALVVTVADNQIETTRYLAELGACEWLGEAEQMSEALFAERLEALLLDPHTQASMSLAMRNVMPDDAGMISVVGQIKSFF